MTLGSKIKSRKERERLLLTVKATIRMMAGQWLRSPSLEGRDPRLPHDCKKYKHVRFRFA